MPSRLQAKAAGGRWDPKKKLWFVRYGKIAATPLEKHIQVDERFRPLIYWLYGEIRK
jgi:hypothetical protein